MSDLVNDRYLILPAGPSAPPPFPVGADIEGPVSPVIVGGSNNVWTVRRLEDGNYTLTLEQGGPRWLSKGVHGKVVVEIMPLPGQWRICRREHGTYSIEIPDNIRPSRAWTVRGTNPGTEVEIAAFEFDPLPGQLWHFKQVLRD